MHLWAFYAILLASPLATSLETASQHTAWQDPACAQEEADVASAFQHKVDKSVLVSSREAKKSMADAALNHSLSLGVAHDYAHVKTLEKATLPFVFDCGSRVLDKPFLSGGASVQYIHVPKAAGSSMQHMLSRLSGTLRMHIHQVDGMCGDPPSNGKTLELGHIYQGHRPIGWCTAKADRQPLYIAILRDPLSRLLSLYDYRVTHPGGPAWAERMRNKLIAQERRLQQAGINQSRALEQLIQEDMQVAKDFVASGQIGYFLPDRCLADMPSTRRGASKDDERVALYADNARLALSVALKNMIRCDVVGTVDTINTDLEPQLLYHAPHLEGKGLFLRRDNVDAREPQVLSDAVARTFLDVLGGFGGFDLDSRLYDFAKRVAKSRTLHAHHARQDDAHCVINVTQTELELLRLPWPTEACSAF